MRENHRKEVSSLTRIQLRLASTSEYLSAASGLSALSSLAALGTKALSDHNLWQSVCQTAGSSLARFHALLATRQEQTSE